MPGMGGACRCAVAKRAVSGNSSSPGSAPAEAWTRARLFYLHLLGEHALAFEERGLPERLAEATRVLLDQRLLTAER